MIPLKRLLACLSLAAAAGLAQTRIDLRTQGKNPIKTGAALPATCPVGDLFAKISAQPGQNLYLCTAANVWTLQAAAGPGNYSGGFALQTTVTIPGPVHGLGTANLQVDCYDNNSPAALIEPDRVLIDPATYDVTVTFAVPQSGRCVVNGSGGGSGAGGGSGSAAGDVIGPWSGTSVVGLQRRPIASAAPADRQALAWNAASGWWEPQTVSGGVTSVFGRSGAVTQQAGDYSASQVTNAVDKSAANSYPAGAKQTFSASSTTAGLRLAPAALPSGPAAGDLHVDSADNRLKVFDGAAWDALQPLPSLAGNAGKLLSTDGASMSWNALGGDVSGTPQAVTVNKIKGRSVGGAAPADKQALAWNAASGWWEPQTVQGGVTSVFGRSGAITQQAGDYAASQVTNAVDKSAANSYAAGAKQTFSASGTTAGLRLAPAGLPGSAAAGDVAVDSADNHLKVFDGAAWTALAPTAANYAGAFTGQTSVTIAGTAHGLETANLLVDCYDNSTPPMKIEPDHVTVDQTTFDVTIAFAVPQSGRCVVNGSGGGSGGGGSASGGAGMAAQLGDFAVTQTGGTALAIGSNCTSGTPCNIRAGSTVYTFVTGATVTLSAGTGIAYVYLDSAGNLVVGHSLTLSCSAGCTAQSGVTSFPLDAIPLFTWTATSGTWDAAGGADKRAFLSGKGAIAGGSGIVTADTGSQVTVSVDTAAVPTYLTGAASLDFGPIAAGQCSADFTLTVSGAAAGDCVAGGWPSDLAAGLLGMMRVSAADTIAVRLCNFSGATLDPPAGTYRATIVRSF